jgi:hypothetical protein
MATKVNLSASTNGRGIKVAATSSAGTTIHTANATAQDEIWAYATNTSTSPVVLTLEFGGTSAPDDNIVITIPPKSGLLQIIPGVPLTNSLVLKAFAGTANVINIFGWVNRIV